jgi:type II secretory pathway component PulK
VIAAEIDGLSLSDARALVAYRNRIPFVNTGEIRLQPQLHGRGMSFSDTDVSTQSRYFFIRGEIKLQRADTRMEALVNRGSGVPGQPVGHVDVVWEREL